MAWDIHQGIAFNDKHTFWDWGFFLKSRPFIAPPQPKTMFVSVPGADGQIDLTEANGPVRYEARDFEAELFMVDNWDNWDMVLSDVYNSIQGQEMTMVLDTDLDYKWTGRFYVESVESERLGLTVVIKGYVEPYKVLRVDESVKSL